MIKVRADFLFIGLFSYFLVTNLSTVLASSEFSVYCSSNMDGTGVCTTEDSREPIECLLLQGSIIGCKKNMDRFRCIQYGKIIANQSQFSCKKTDAEAKSIVDQSANSTRQQDYSTQDINQDNINPYEFSTPKSTQSIMDGVF